MIRYTSDTMVIGKEKERCSKIFLILSLISKPI